MKLSESTLKVLKNFSGINQSINIRAGNLLSTQSVAKNIVAEANIEEEFPVGFCLYDLPEFLGTMKLFKSPVLDFSEAQNNYMYICEEDNLGFKVRYTFSKPELIVYPERRPEPKAPEITFNLDAKTLDSIMKASTVMQLTNMLILPSEEEGKVRLEVTTLLNKSSNKFSIDIEGNAPVDRKFRLIFNMDTFKMTPNAYSVGISGGKVSAFYSDFIDYFIGLDKDSRL